MSNRQLALALACLASIALAACSGDRDPPATAASTADNAPMTPDPGPAPNPIVGGVRMDPQKDIVANAGDSAEHTTLVSALQAAGLVETLQGPGPFTVFAPTDSAFMVLPEGMLERLMQPENQDELARVLTYHVVEGALDSAALKQRIVAGNGLARLATVAGGTLTVEVGPAGGLRAIDAGGNPANLSVTDIRLSNGVIHVVDEVLMP